MNEQQNNGLSVSFRIDDGIIEHNNRSFIAKNVVRERIPDNITYKKQNIREFYSELFGEALADVFNAFTANEDICSKLVENESQFTNNTNVNQKYAEDPNYGNAFLGGQNDTAIFVELAKNIKFENKTQYDQLLSEGLPKYMLDYFTGEVSKDEALANFYSFVNDKYPAIVTP